MNVTVVHGFAKIPLTLENLEESTVEDLIAQLEEKSGVPKESQKIIFKVGWDVLSWLCQATNANAPPSQMATRQQPPSTVVYVILKRSLKSFKPPFPQSFQGKTLSDRSQRLDTVGLKSGAKLMLIGKKFCPEEEAAFRQLDDLKSQCQTLATKLDEHQTDFENVSGGFLSQELVPQRLEQLRKNVLTVSEQGMKVLTSIDAIRLGEETDAVKAESVKNEFKTRRKTLVDRVNSLMDSAETLLGKVEEMKAR